MKRVSRLGFALLIAIPVFAQTQKPQESSLPDFIMEGGAQGEITLYSRRDSWDPERMEKKARDAFLATCRVNPVVGVYDIDSGTNSVAIRFRSEGRLTEEEVRRLAGGMTERLWREARIGWSLMERRDDTMKWTGGGPPVGEVFSREVDGELVPVFSWEVPEVFGESPVGESDKTGGNGLPYAEDEISPRNEDEVSQ